MSIRNKLKEFFKKGTFRMNAVTMFSGSLFSQAIYLLFYPVLTRIYSTSDFGRYAIFISFLSVLGVLATGQYELALLLPKKQRSLKSLTLGAILLSIIMGVVITMCLILAYPLLLKYGYFDSQGLVAFLGLSVFIYALYQISFYIALRKKDFKSLSIINIANVGFSILFQYLLSKTELKASGLSVGYIGGTLIATVLLIIKGRNVFWFEGKNNSLFSEIKAQLIRYKNFPLVNLPATFVNLFTNQVPQLMLNTFGQTVVGYFSLSQRVLGSPITIFSTSISYVFKERASSDYRTKGNCRPIFLQTFKSLFLISIVPFILLFILAPIAVPFVFGQEWEPAGMYIRALTLMYFFKFTVSPLTYVIIIAEKQRLNLVLQIILLTLTSIFLYMGIRAENPFTSIILYSISYSFVYCIFLIISYKLSKNENT